VRLALLALALLALGVLAVVLHKRASRPPEPIAAAVEESPAEPAPPPARPAPPPEPRPASRDARPAPRSPRARQNDEPADAGPAKEDEGEKRRALEAAMQRVSIRMYTTQWCPRCREAKAWLAAHHQGYSELDVEASDGNRRAQRALNPAGGVPTIDVEGEVLVGFSAGSLDGAIRRAALRRLP
jgi:glutaredoxin 3